MNLKKQFQVMFNNTVVNQNRVDESIKIAEDFAIGFASYLDGYWEVNTKRTKTIKELLEIYKKKNDYEI